MVAAAKLIFATVAVPPDEVVNVSFSVIAPDTFFNFKIFLALSNLTIIPVAPPENDTDNPSEKEPVIDFNNTLLMKLKFGAGDVS